MEAKVFIDATYEGDLMAKAGVSYTTGREGNDVYGETLNGVQVRNTHQFSHAVDPYVRKGDPSSGLLPYVETEDLSARQGTGDGRVQAYCFRMCMTDDPTLIDRLARFASAFTRVHLWFHLFYQITLQNLQTFPAVQNPQ